MASFWLSSAFLLSLCILRCYGTTGCRLDLGFIIDESGSIGRSGFAQEIGFIKNMVVRMDISSATSHVSVMAFGSRPRMINYFNEQAGYSKLHLALKLNAARYQGGGTYTESALNLARTTMFSSSRGARSNCNKVVIVFTDGRSNTGVSRVTAAAKRLKDMGIKIISIGVGRSISTSELHGMASSSGHVFRVSSASALTQILSKVKTEICKERTCWQVSCEYNSWSAWSSSCGSAKRQRTLKKKSFSMRKGIGGCAAFTTNCLVLAESKTLAACPTIRTTGGTANGAACVFPFLYNGRTYTQCTKDGHNQLWCSTTYNFAKDRKWGNCLPTTGTVCKLDIGFILDESGSIGRTGFNQELQFVKNIAKQLSVSGSNTHVSVMTFASSAIIRNYFRDSSGQSQYYLERMLGSVRYRGGGTDTERALNLARSHMFHESFGARKGISKIVIVFTDGRSASGVTRVANAAKRLKDMGINMISIGVGRYISVSELNAMASTPISSHVFRVSSAGMLNSIVSKVKSESCKAVTCVYAECTYGQWGAWSRTCGDATRSRKQLTKVMKTKQVTAGCAGVSKTCHLQEQKNLGVCLANCKYAVCSWGSWGAWSTTCGFGSRTRNIATTYKYIKRVHCNGLQTSCKANKQYNVRNTYCVCNYVHCGYSSWSSWSTSCGSGRRSRSIVAIKKTISRKSCSGLTQSCRKHTKYDSRSQYCKCNYVVCSTGSWGSWSTSCGAGQRTRAVTETKRSILRLSCSGLLQSCSSVKKSESRNTLCTCKYVACSYGPWSSWTTSCGAGQRSRKMVSTPKTVQRASCAGLPKSCSTAVDVDKRTKLCTCKYVACSYGPWSSWTTSCGVGQRSRKMVNIPKTVQKASCAGLPQSCSTAVDVDKRTKLCTCSFVECKYGPWSAWSTSCGAGERSRKMVSKSKTVQKASCAGLPQSCSKTPDVEKRTELCTCNFVECEYGPWSAWSTSCGAGERSRKMVASPKTEKKASCDGLPKTCSKTPDVEQRTELCTCNFVECEYGPWSVWTTTCGAGERARKLVPTQKTEKRASCDGLAQSCSKTPDVENRMELCTCNFVECEYGAWSAWSTSCGAGERSRTMVASPKTEKKASCDGLPQSCSKTPDVQKRTELCTCKFVECEYGPWSAWSTSCGAGERSRKMVASPKTEKKASCDGLPQSCSKTPDVQKRTELCTCNFVECAYGPWSAWTTTCGAGERARKLVATQKTEKKASCDGLPKECSKTPDVIKRTTMCDCQTVRCQPSEWSQWSATCGKASRTIRLVSIPVTLKRPSCDGLPTKCKNTKEVETRDKTCKEQQRDQCSVSFKPRGCYVDDMKDPRPMPEMLLTERDSTHPAWNGKYVDWGNWNTYIVKLICRCAEKAKSKNYKFFGLQFYGECWSGPEAGGSFMRNGLRGTGSCLKENYAPCLAGDKYCVGVKETNYVYEINP